MDIKILDSWLREHLKTAAKPKDIANALSLTSASVEKIEELGHDYLYHVEVTTNRIDMVSVIGIAREAAAVLPQFGFEAIYKEPHVESKITTSGQETIEITNNDKLVKRICYVILEVTKKESPQYIKDRLESAGIRSLHNLIDVTNYVMLEIGHPTHAFDYDRLITKKLIIREAKKGEKIVTLDKKEHKLLGGDIVADNGKGEIVDLLGVMGTLNSVVTEHTNRILFFIDNNDPVQIRKTSMSLGIRTEAASINEKDVDPELAMTALQRGIALYKEVADAKVVSEIMDIYPHPWKPKIITVSEEKMQQVIGIPISLQESLEMLKRLDFKVKQEEKILHVTIPSYRDADMQIAEDVIEEIARIYGYHNLPSALPTSSAIIPHQEINAFFWENRVKDALKYWGFSEVYTYSMVSEKLLDVPKENAISLKNPLDEDHVYMRTTLLPSLLEVLEENKSREEVKIFELSHVYQKRQHDLPQETKLLSGVVKGKQEDFFTVKGIIEQLANDLGIMQLLFDSSDIHKDYASIYVLKSPISHPHGEVPDAHTEYIGEIKIAKKLVTFEINFTVLQQHATLKKVYTPLAKFPPILEDMSFIIDSSIKTGDIIIEIQRQSRLIKDVSLLDQYEDKRTFHIIYQDKEKNLTSEEVTKIREKIIEAIKKKFHGIHS